jgi:ribosome-binding factor A
MLDARDPRLADVTITSVDITPDLLLARVYFTVMAEGDERVAEAQAGLERATGFLRTQLAARLQLRLVPHLAFELDKSAAYGRRIDELLGELAKEGDHPIPNEQERD